VIHGVSLAFEERYGGSVLSRIEHNRNVEVLWRVA